MALESVPTDYKKTSLKYSIMRYIILFLFVFFFLLGFGQKVPICQKQRTGDVINIDLYQAYLNYDNFPLSTVVESLEYIPIETNGKCLLGESMKRVFITTNEIFIFDYNAVFRFSRSGKFINKIGRIGKGPGECLKPIDMVLDTLNQNVILLDHDKLVKYDYKGNFINSHTLKNRSNSMLQINDEDLLVNNMFYLYAKPGERFSMFFFSQEQKKEISKIACEKKDKIPFCICDPVMYTHNHQAFVKDYWGDTIYKVIDPFTLKAYVAINTGKLKHRDNDDKSIVTGEKNPGDTWVVDITYISETSRYIFLTSNKGLFIYDKKNKETRCCNFRKENEQWVIFNNDLTAGPDLMPFIHVHPVGIASFVTYNYAHNFFNENGTIKSGLPPSLKKLNPNDNPVLVLIKFNP